MKKGAAFSICGQYRYSLWRIWDDSKPFIQFVGLNPSTANEETDDPTIRRVISFAQGWGYGGVYMTNLFAIVSPDPKLLKTCPDPIADNDGWLKIVAGMCETVLFAWGSFKEAKERAEIVSAMFPAAVCLGINADGSPKHPLYIKGDTKQINFK